MLMDYVAMRYFDFWNFFRNAQMVCRGEKHLAEMFYAH